MNKKRLLIKIIVSSVLVLITVLSFVLVDSYNKKKALKVNSGKETISVELTLVDSSSTVIWDEHYDVKWNDETSKSEQSLYELLESKHTVRASDSLYGKFIYDIDEIKTDAQKSFIAIYVNDTLSDVGISSILLYDGIRVKFVETPL